MMSVDFQSDGKVKIFSCGNGDTFSVTTDANRIPEVVPAPMLMNLRERMLEFLALTCPPKTEPRTVNPQHGKFLGRFAPR